MNMNVSKESNNKTPAIAPVVKSYAIKDRHGREHVVRFTKKRAQVLQMLQEGKTREFLLDKGFSSSIISVVGWQAKKLGLLKTGEVKATK